MPIGEILLTAIADAVFGYLVDKHGDTLEERVRGKAGRDAIKKAFKAAFGKAFAEFEYRHPQWVAEHFNASFFEHEGAPVLAQFLMRDGHPDPSELAVCWADSLNMRQPERRSFYIHELEPVATDFLDIFARHLKAQKVLRELHDSRAFEQLASDVRAMRRRFEEAKATRGTRLDYLRWLIARNLYIDTRGTFQTQRQVQVKLDEVYISLRAQRETPPGEGDVDILLVIDALDEGPIAQQQTFLTNLQNAGGFSRQTPITIAGMGGMGKSLLLRRMRELSGTSQSDRFDDLLAAGERLELAMAVHRHDRLIILGDPGSGKTTLLRYLALKHAQALYHGRSEASSELGSPRFPLLIRIAEYAEENTWKKQSFSDFLVKSYVLHECPSEGLADLLHHELEEGNCLVLLDGLDEIVRADERRGVVRQVEDFVRRFIDRGNRFVITSRVAGYRSAPLGEAFVRFTVQDMDEEQISHFLERWCQAVEDTETPETTLEVRKRVARREVDGILKAIRDSPGVRRLAANPLLLRTLALIHRTGAQLPQKRIELYKLAADALARTWRTAQGVPESALVDEKHLTRLLGRLAYWLHENKPTGVATEGEVYAVLGKELARIKDIGWEEDNPVLQNDIEQFLRMVREHTGLFVERAPGRYGFMHLTFEEYYASRYLVARRKTSATLIRSHLHHPRWDEPVLLALGFVGLDTPEDAADLVETAILAQGEDAQELGFGSSPYEDLVARNYLFALHCLGDDVPVHQALLTRLLNRLADELLHHMGLARFKRYRSALDESLASLQGSQAGTMFSSHLLSVALDTDNPARERAIVPLVRLGSRSLALLTRLTDALLHERDDSVRRTVMKCLPQLEHTSDALLALLIDLLQDKDLWVRCEAARTLWQLHQWHLARTVVKTLFDAHLEYYRDAGNEYDPGPEFHLFLEEIWDSLDLTTDEAAAVLLRLLSDTDTNVRQQAATLLGRLDAQALSANVIPPLLAALDESDFWVSTQSAVSLVHLGYESDAVIDVLLEALTGDEPNLQFTAIEAVGRLRHVPDTVLTVLLDLLRKRYDLLTADGVGDAFVEEVFSVLGASGRATPEVIATLTQALHDHHPLFCQAAVLGLERLAPTSLDVVDALLALLHEKDSSIRSYAAHCLGAMDPEEVPQKVVSALLEALHDPERAVQYRAAESLGQLDQLSLAIVATLLEAIPIDDSGWSRPDLLSLLAPFGVNDQSMKEIVLKKLSEAQITSSNAHIWFLQADIRSWCRLGRRFPYTVDPIVNKFIRALEDPLFDRVCDDLYEGLWLLVVGSEDEEAKEEGR